MPHAAIVAAAVSASVAAAVAFELGVFKPWRQENWPEGVGQGLKDEWESFKRDVQEGLHDISGGRDRDMRGRRRMHEDDDDDDDRRTMTRDDREEEAMLRSEMEEFEMHQRESTLQRQRMMEDMREQAHEQTPPTNDGSLYSNYTEAIKEARNPDGTAYVIRKRTTRPTGPLIDATSDSNVLAPPVSYIADEISSPHHDVGEASPSVASISLMSLEPDNEKAGKSTTAVDTFFEACTAEEAASGRRLDLHTALINDGEETADGEQSSVSRFASLADDSADDEPVLHVSPPESVSNWTVANMSTGTRSAVAWSDDEEAVWSSRGSSHADGDGDRGRDSDDDWVPLQHSRNPSPELS